MTNDDGKFLAAKDFAAWSARFCFECLKPHALHSVFFPSGPFLRTGVRVILHFAHRHGDSSDTAFGKFILVAGGDGCLRDRLLDG